MRISVIQIVVVIIIGIMLYGNIPEKINEWKVYYKKWKNDK